MNKLKESFSENEWLLIEKVESTGRKYPDGTTVKWITLAREFNIKPEGSSEQRRKAANDVWRKYNRKKDKLSIVPKRLYYDIETSYNIGKFWRTGYNQTINPGDIIHERAIICVSYKWEGENKIHTLSWNKGDDKELVEKFIEVMSQADELVGHNIDRYDTKFLLTRAIVHGILGLPKYNSHDTLKIAKKHFMFNSNKLDYIAKLLGLNGKLEHAGMPMWDAIVLHDVLGMGTKVNRDMNLNTMMEYCEQDVLLTEEVYKRLKMYTETKMHHGVLNGAEKHTCPDCGLKASSLIRTDVTKAGTIKRLMECSCEDCGNTHFFISNTNYLKHYDEPRG